MANKKTTEKSSGNGGTAADEFGGFVNDTADRDAAWFKAQNGNVLIGELLGAFDMPDQFNKGSRRDYVQVSLLADTQVDDGDGGVETAGKGDVVSLGITSGLQVILEKHVPMVEAGAKIHLRVTVTGPRTKSKQSGNSYWPFKVESKVVRPPTRTVVPRAARVATNSVAPAAGADMEEAF